MLLWPNFCVLELAPTTAMKGEERKVFMDASVLMAGDGGERSLLLGE